MDTEHRTTRQNEAPNFSLGAIESSGSHITGLDVSFAHSKFRNGEEWADVERRAIVNQYPCHYHFGYAVPYYLCLVPLEGAPHH